MVIIGRHINGITINPLEYLLDDNGDVMEFNSNESAKSFFREQGFMDDEIDWFIFEIVQEGGG